MLEEVTARFFQHPEDHIQQSESERLMPLSFQMRSVIERQEQIKSHEQLEVPAAMSALPKVGIIGVGTIADNVSTDRTP